MLNSYQAYAILEGTAVRPLREIPGENRTYKTEAIKDADRMKGQYPAARVIVVNTSNQIVYEAE